MFVLEALPHPLKGIFVLEALSPCSALADFTFSIDFASAATRLFAQVVKTKTMNNNGV